MIRMNFPDQDFHKLSFPLCIYIYIYIDHQHCSTTTVASPKLKLPIFKLNLPISSIPSLISRTNKITLTRDNLPFPPLSSIAYSPPWQRKEICWEEERERERDWFVFTRACRVQGPPGGVSPSTWDRRCCCSWSAPRPRPTRPRGWGGGGDGGWRRVAGAVGAGGRRGRRQPRNGGRPDRRQRPVRSLCCHLHPGSGGATSTREGRAPLDTAPTWPGGCEAPAPFHLQRLPFPTVPVISCRGWCKRLFYSFIFLLLLFSLAILVRMGGKESKSSFPFCIIRVEVVGL